MKKSSGGIHSRSNSPFPSQLARGNKSRPYEKKGYNQYLKNKYLSIRNLLKIKMETGHGTNKGNHTKMP
jgi:hypothetical protein